MRLGIDLDGVVADFNTGWITRYNADFERDIPLDAVRAWDGIHELTHFPDMQGFWRWARDHGQGTVFRHLEVYDGAVASLDRLQRAGNDIIIITTKPEWAIHDTFAWLAEHRVPTREVHITWAKWRIPCDVYLDDAPHQIERIHRSRPEAAMCRFVRPWNDPVPGVHDISGWPEFVELVEGLEFQASISTAW
jgi:5'(3')-deoxyribonucleotidase